MSKIVFKYLEDVCDVNDFYEVDTIELLQGEAATIYFRLVTVRASDAEDRLSDVRYLANSGATINVQFQALDSNQIINRPAVMAFPLDDRSIWSVNILATDKLTFGGMKLTLTEGIKVRTILPGAATKLKMSSSDGSGRFFC